MRPYAIATGLLLVILALLFLLGALIPLAIDRFLR